MENKTTIGRFGGTVLLINLICAKVFLNFPRLLIEDSGTAAWIQLIYVTIIAFILLAIILKLYSIFEGMDLVDILQFLGGSILTKIIGSIIVIYLTITVSIIIREYCENMKTVSLEVSPLFFVLMFFMSSAVIGTYKGIEIVVRSHTIGVPLIAGTFLAIVFLAYPNYNIDNFFPIMGNGIKSIFVKGFLGISTYSPIIYLFLLPPFIKSNKTFKSVVWRSFFISASFVILVTLAITMAFPYPASTESFLPFYSLTRLIYYGRFFERIESVFIVIWTLSGVMYMSAIFFMIVYFFKKSFKLQYHKPLILPIAIIIIVVSFLPKNTGELIQFDTKFYGVYSWMITFIMPIVILIAANLKKKIAKKGDQKSDKKSC